MRQVKGAVYSSCRHEHSGLTERGFDAIFRRRNIDSGDI